MSPKDILSHPITSTILISMVVAGFIYLTPLKHINIIPVSISEVTNEVFYERYQENPDEYLIIDVRKEADFIGGHIDGAVNIPLHLLYDRWNTLPKTGKKIVLVCTRNRESGVGYSYLEHHGFLNLQRITDGMYGWNNAGLPTVNGFQ